MLDVLPVIAISAAERAAGRLSERHHAVAVDAMATHGVLKITGAVEDLAAVEALRKRMLQDMAAYEASGGILSHNWQGLRPPPCHPFLHEELIFNKFAVEIAQRLVGDPDTGGLALGQINSNTAYAVGPGHPDISQEVHTDSNEPYNPAATSGFDGPTKSVYCNVVLSAMAAATGATECWLGTHNDPGLRHGRGFGDPHFDGGRRSTSWPTPAMIAAWESKHGRSVHTVAKPGDLILRDARVWHRGVANRGPEHRPMIRMSYSSHPLHTCPGLSFEAEEGTEAFWRSHPMVQVSPRFVPAPIDYLDTTRYNSPGEDKMLGVYPGRYACGLTGVLMSDPVRTSSGIAFERARIETWLEGFRRQGHPLRDPNGNVVVDGVLHPDEELKEEIAKWVKRRLLQSNL